MIAFLRGKLVSVEADTVIVDVQGVGYRVNVTGALLAMLPKDKDKAEVFIHTHMIVREDSMQLYGFISPEEITVFTLLLNVKGVGPKVAMAVLSHLTPQGLGRAVMQEDVPTLIKVPGVGKKTAQRMVLELKDKFKQLNLKSDGITEVPGSTAITSVLEDAVEALLALGYGDSEARGAVQRAVEFGARDLAESVRMALRFLDKTKN